MSSESAESGSGCFKKGCLGCAAVLGLGLGLILLLSLLSWVGSSVDADPQRREVRQDLPALPAAGLPAEATDGENPPQTALTLDGEAARELGMAEQVAGAAHRGEPVTLALDLSMGTFVVEPGPADQPVRIEADYDQARFELEEHFNADSRVYGVRFGRKRGLLSLFQFGEVHNEVKIVVPRGYPLVLVGEIAMGESRLDLGGLGLKEVDFDVGMGAHHIEFSEPTPEGLVLFDVEGSMGELKVRDLGNASPVVTRLDLAMGSLEVGLRGAWRNDGEVAIECGMGDCSLRGPGQEAELIVDRAEVSLGESYVKPRDEAPEGVPQVRLTVDGAMGEVRVD